MAGPWEKYAQPQGVQTKPADPRIPYQLQQEQAQAAAAPYAAPKAQADLARTRQQMSLDAQTAPAEIQSKQANARKAQIEADNLEKTGGAGVEQSRAAGFYSRALKANDMYGQTGVGAPSILRESAKAILPEALVNSFTDDPRQAAEALQRDFVAASLRYESGAAIPEPELESQRKIYFPAPGDSEPTIALKAKLRANAIESLKIGAGPAADQVVGGQTFMDQARDRGNFAAPTVAPAAGDLVSEYDGQASAAFDRLIRLGRPYAEIAAYAQSKGFNPPNRAAVSEARSYMKTNPGYKGGFAQASRTRPTTFRERLAASPASSYFNGAGTALTAGFNDEMAGGVGALLGGNYEEGRDAFNAKKAIVANTNPNADLAGSVTGSVLGMLGAGSAAGAIGGRFGSAMTARGGLGADTAYGATMGAGQNNENRGQGALLGGVAALGGNLLGQGAAKTLGGLVSPSGGSMRDLYDLGARPSIGQRIGGGVDRAEQMLQSVPVIGAAVRGTRGRARDQGERGIFNDALREVGASLPEDTPLGPQAHRFKQATENRVYDEARAGMQMVPDSQLGADLGNLQQVVGQLTDTSAARFNRIWRDEVARRMRGQNALTGSAYKDAQAALGKRIRKVKLSDPELADALGEASMALDGAARRSSPAEAVAKLDAADRFYAKGVAIDTASNYAGGEAGRMSPSQYLRAVKNEDGGLRGRGFNAGNALNQGLAEQFARLGDTVPNSYSGDRLMQGALTTGAIGGAGLLEPTTLGATGLYGLLNAPGVRNMTTGILAPRKSKTLQELAEELRRASPLLGSIGAGAALSLPPR